FRELTDLQLRVHARDRVERQRYVVTGEGAETGDRDRHGVGAGRNGGEVVRAGCVGHHLTLQFGFFLLHDDGRSRQRRAGGVGDVADDGSVEDLRASGRRGSDNAHTHHGGKRDSKAGKGSDYETTLGDWRHIALLDWQIEGLSDHQQPLAGKTKTNAEEKRRDIGYAPGPE